MKAHRKQRASCTLYGYLERAFGNLPFRFDSFNCTTSHLDWHCVYSPDGKFMSGETYWNKYNERSWVLVRLADGMTMPIGSFYVPPEYRGGYWRCDLHARYRPDVRQIAFNSVHEGSRQVYVIDIKE